MDIQFFSTGDRFPYGYYLSIMSALKTQKVDKVNLWVTEKPTGRFFPIIVDRVNVIYTDMPDILPIPKDNILKDSGFPIDKVRYAHMKDILVWNILYEYGGVALDLDTFCIDDLCCLLGNKDVAATPYTRWGLGSTLYPFNNAIVIAKPKSIIIKEALDNSMQALTSEINPAFQWGISGPIAFSNAIHRHYDLVAFYPQGTFGDVIKNTADITALFREDGVIISKNARVVHLYASTNNVFYDIDKDYIADGKVPFARMVSQILSKDEWYI